MSKITIKYVGKPSEFVGKTLWEIVGNLKDFGVGRIVVRNSYASRYQEPCFMRILDVTAEPNEIPPKIQVFRWPNDFRDKDVSLRCSLFCLPFTHSTHTHTVQNCNNRFMEMHFRDRAEFVYHANTCLEV